MLSHPGRELVSYLWLYKGILYPAENTNSAFSSLCSCKDSALHGSCSVPLKWCGNRFFLQTSKKSGHQPSRPSQPSATADLPAPVLGLFQQHVVPPGAVSGPPQTAEALKHGLDKRTCLPLTLPYASCVQFSPAYSRSNPTQPQRLLPPRAMPLKPRCPRSDPSPQGGSGSTPRWSRRPPGSRRGRRSR